MVRGRGGFRLEMRFRLDDLTPHQTLFEARDENGRGAHLSLSERGAVRLTMSGALDGFGAVSTSIAAAECAWECDAGLLRAGEDHHVVAIVDGGPKIISFVVDGLLCDGGEARIFGWSRFHDALDDINGASHARLAPDARGEVEILRLYNRALRTSEAVGNFNAEKLYRVYSKSE